MMVNRQLFFFIVGINILLYFLVYKGVFNLDIYFNLSQYKFWLTGKYQLLLPLIVIGYISLILVLKGLVRKIFVYGFLPLYFGLAFVFLNIFGYGDLFRQENLIYVSINYIFVLIYYYWKYEKYVFENKNRLDTFIGDSFVSELQTIMFIDIQDYTTISEKLKKPVTIGNFLNTYINFIEKIIIKYDGLLDKIMGDGLMLIFRGKNKEINAMACAINLINIKNSFINYIQDEVINHLDRNSDPSRYADFLKIFTVLNETDFNIRIGISTGEVFFGKIGGKDINEVTIIGDEVNLASRLESINKKYGTGILCDEDTVKCLGKQFSFRVIDKIKVKGKQEPKYIYQPLYFSKDNVYNLELSDEIIMFWDKIIKMYFNRQWEDGLNAIEEYIRLVPDDKVGKVFLRRFNAVICNSVSIPYDWDGVRVDTILAS